MPSHRPKAAAVEQLAAVTEESAAVEEQVLT